MLKIKDNVDLKELEKYGFEEDYIIDESCYIKEYKKGYYKESLIIWLDRKGLQCNGIVLLDTVYDLIKDGLVEKVEK